MNSREHFIRCFKAEKPTFLKVFRALPADQLSYRPHPRSTSAGDLVWLLAGELNDACDLIDHHQVAFKPAPAPARLDDAIGVYEKNGAELERRLAKVDDTAWATSSKFLVDGNVAWEAPLGDMLWGFLFDAIHHRGQLSAYIRPMGGKVPSIYGPSADDPGM